MSLEEFKLIDAKALPVGKSKAYISISEVADVFPANS